MCALGSWLVGSEEALSSRFAISRWAVVATPSTCAWLCLLVARKMSLVVVQGLSSKAFLCLEPVGALGFPLHCSSIFTLSDIALRRDCYRHPCCSIRLVRVHVCLAKRLVLKSDGHAPFSFSYSRSHTHFAEPDVCFAEGLLPLLDLRCVIICSYLRILDLCVICLGQFAAAARSWSRDCLADGDRVVTVCMRSLV